MTKTLRALLLAIVLFTARPALMSAASDLAVSPSGHYVTYQGKPLLLVGESGTHCVMQNANIDYVRWIDDCAANDLNNIHIWSFVGSRQKLDGSVVEPRYGYVYPSLMPWARKTAGPRATDGGFQYDLLRWDEGTTPDHYWPRLRDLCRRAEAKGLVLGITVFFGWPKHQQDDWPWHPFNAVNGGPLTDHGSLITQVQAIHSPGAEVLSETWSDAWPLAKKNQYLWERFAQKLLDETAPFKNIYFIFMDEHSYSEGNGGDHFLEFFKRRGALWVDWNPRRSRVDMVYGYVNYTPEDGRNRGTVAEFNKRPARPFLAPESPPEEPYHGDLVRHILWTMLAGGGHYIYHADYGQETVTTGIMGYDPHVPGGDTGMIRRVWLGHAARFFDTVVKKLDALAPHNELIGEGCFCLAAPGTEYVVYAGPKSPPAIRLDLKQAQGHFACEFYNPKTGAKVKAGTQSGGALITITKPSMGDWVLHVLKQP